MVESLPVMILGRIIQGFTTGMNSVVIPLYNIEMADLSVKGRVGGIHVSMLSFGIGLGLAMELFISKGQDGTGSQIWRPLMGLAGVFHIARFIIFYYYLTYETPLYLALKDRANESLEVLKVFYKNLVDAEEQLQRVLRDKEAVAARGNPTLKDMLTDRYKKAFFVSIFFLSGVQLSGFSPIFMFFSVFASKSAGDDPEVLSIFATILGAISFLTVVLSTVIIDKFGRRSLIIYGMGFVTVTEFIYTLVSWVGGLENPFLKYILIIWPFFYRLSVGTLGFIYPAEVLPGIGVSICFFTNWMLGFIVIQAFMPLVYIIGVTGTMFLFSSYCLTSTIVCYKHIVETKGRSKAEILEIYRKEDQVQKHLNNNDLELSLLRSSKKDNN